MSDRRQIIDIKQEFILPLPFRIFGFTMLLAGIIILVVHSYELATSGIFSWWLPGSIIIGITGSLIATAHYRLCINTQERWFNIYIWMLGFKQGRREHFRRIENIYMNRVLQNTRISSYTGHVNEVKEYLYKAFMKLDTGEKVHLDTDKTEHLLETRIKNYMREFGDLYRAGEPESRT